VRTAKKGVVKRPGGKKGAGWPGPHPAGDSNVTWEPRVRPEAKPISPGAPPRHKELGQYFRKKGITLPRLQKNGKGRVGGSSAMKWITNTLSGEKRGQKGGKSGEPKT